MGTQPCRSACPGHLLSCGRRGEHFSAALCSDTCSNISFCVAPGPSSNTAFASCFLLYRKEVLFLPNSCIPVVPQMVALQPILWGAGRFSLRIPQLHLIYLANMS